jgi:hypothetical protein
MAFSSGLLVEMMLESLKVVVCPSLLVLSELSELPLGFFL